MAEDKKQVTTADRLARHLGLFQPGSMVTIDIITPAGQKARYRVVFIGYLPEKYVLIQMPDPNKLGGFSVHIKQGVKVTVRGIIEGHEGSVVAFASKIQQTVQNPSRTLVLDFPNEVGLQRLRDSLRIYTDIKAVVVVNDEKWHVKMTNLSMSGCQLYIKNGQELVFNNERKIRLFIEKHPVLDNLKLKVNVCNIKKLDDSISIGVSFDEKNKTQVERLLLTALENEF